MADEKKEWYGEVSDCQLCRRKITTEFIDGLTQRGISRLGVIRRSGAWAIMCPNCHSKYGVGTGTGKGQMYRLEDSKWIKVNG